MADPDLQLEIKKRARRRLVGAVAVALAAAIVLPMVMDQEPKPLGQDIQIRIPSQDQPALPAPKFTPAPEAAATAPKEPAPLEPAPATAKPPAEEPPIVVPAPESTVPTPAQPPQQRAAIPAKRTEEKPREKSRATESKPPQKAAAKADAEAARAQAALAGAREQYIVQLGVFANAESARRIGARAKAAGYNSYTEALPGSGGAKTRVRAGPFPSRAEAERALDKLKGAGLNGLVVPKT